MERIGMEKNGGPAFPAQPVHHFSGAMSVEERAGMSLRDYFAAAALPVVWQILFRQMDARCYPEQHVKDSSGYAAGMCYEMADAMLKARATDTAQR